MAPKKATALFAPALALVLGSAVLPMAAASAEDQRLSSRAYNPDEIVRIDGKLNVQATIAFGEGEKIENVAVGDSESWQIAPNKRADLLFIKPLTPDARTNMTVVTDRHTYFFDLVASPKAQPIYSLKFTYALPAVPTAPATAPTAVAAPVVAAAAPAAAATAPARPSEAERRVEARRTAAVARAAREAEAKRRDDQRKAERQAARARAAAEARQQAEARAEQARQRAASDASSQPAKADQPVVATAAPSAAAPAATVAAATAPAWKRTGPRELMPRRIYDDGVATYAVWPADKPLPQLLVSDAQGREVPVNFTVDGEKIVIAGVPSRIIVRANGKSGLLESARPLASGRSGGQ